MSVVTSSPGGDALAMASRFATVGMVAAVYLKTAFASIPGGDSGELVAESCTLGHAHPPGYPLFTMLYHVAIKILPWDASISPAWRANATTSILGALTAGLVQSSILELFKIYGLGESPSLEQNLLASGVAAAFALSPLTWMYSTGAEVFALNNFLVAALVVVSLQYFAARSESLRRRWIHNGAYMAGLALCNQHTAVLFGVPLVACVILHEFREKRISVLTFVRWTFLFVLSLLPYLYLPWTLLTNRQPGSWGDTTTLTGFIHHLRRGDYGTFRLFSRNKSGDMGMWGRIGLYVSDLCANQGAIVLPFFALLGAVMLMKRWYQVAFVGPSKAKSTRPPRGLFKRRRDGKDEVEELEVRPTAAKDSELRRALAGPALVGAFLFYILVFHFLSNMPMDQDLLRGIQARFWMQPNIVVFIVSALFPAYHLNNLRSQGHRFLAILLGVTLACILPAYQYHMYENVSDQSNNYYMENYAKAIVAGLPANSVLMVGYDQQWTSLRYLQQCEGFRPDLAIVNGPMLTYEWQGSYYEAYQSWSKCARFPPGYWVHSHSQPYIDKEGFSTTEMFAMNLEACPGGFYFTGKLNHATDTTYNDTYILQSMGFVTQVLPRQQEPSFEGWLARSVEVWHRAFEVIHGDLPPLEKYSPETWEWTVRRDLFDKTCADAQLILEKGIQQNNVDMMIYAATTFRNAYESDHSGFSPDNIKNLGLAYVSLARALPQPDAEGNIAFARHPALKIMQDQHVHLLFKDVPGTHWHTICAKNTIRFWEEYMLTSQGRMDSQRNTIADTLVALRKIVERHG